MNSENVFQQWFCLKNRLNFTIDPLTIASDAQFYFGRDETKEILVDQLRKTFVNPGIPKMMIYGPFGSGKTHTLFHLEHILRNDPPKSCRHDPYTVYAVIEMRSNSDANHLHAQIMEALGKDVVTNWARELADTQPDLDASIGELTEDFNIRSALKEIRITGPQGFNAWRWLTGQPLKTAELDALQITRNLGDVSTGDLASALCSIGKLATSVGKSLIFFLDELEGLNNVRVGDNADSISQYIRRLAEPGNSSVGFIIGFMSNVRDDVPSIIDRGDIRTRIGESNYLEIGALPAVANVKAFITELVSDLVDKECANEKIKAKTLKTKFGKYPFDTEALDVLAEYALQEPTLALPRLLIHAINECAIQAWDEEKPVITATIVNSIGPSVFEPVY